MVRMPIGALAMLSPRQLCITTRRPCFRAKLAVQGQELSNRSALIVSRLNSLDPSLCTVERISICQLVLPALFTQPPQATERGRHRHPLASSPRKRFGNQVRHIGSLPSDADVNLQGRGLLCVMSVHSSRSASGWSAQQADDIAEQVSRSERIRARSISHPRAPSPECNQTADSRSSHVSATHALQDCYSGTFRRMGGRAGQASQGCPCELLLADFLPLLHAFEELLLPRLETSEGRTIHGAFLSCDLLPLSPRLQWRPRK